MKTQIARLLMVSALVLSAIACIVVAARGQGNAPDSQPWAVPGLTLDAARKATAGDGYLKIKAQAKGQVQFKVEADFELEGTQFKWEALPDNQVLVAIPDSPGLITISAVALVDGKLTPFATTAIEVEPHARKGTGPEPATPPTGPPGNVPAPSPAPGPSPRGPAGALHLYAVIDTSAGGPYAALAQSAPFRQGLGAMGVTLHVLTSSSAAVAKQGLTKFVSDAGGAPALVLVEQGTGKVWLAARMPDDVNAALTLVKAKAQP